MFAKSLKPCTMPVVSLLFFAFFTSSCASRKDEPGPIQHRGHTQRWDYDQIRRNQEIEPASRPTDFDLDRLAEEQASGCTLLTREQMQRSRASGCRPVDEREGLGSGMYCCDL